MISIPTGVLFFNWLATLRKGHLRFEPPMLFALGFIAMFLIGGIDGVWTAAPAMDFAIHDTYWVVAHIHYVLVRRDAVRRSMAGVYYWFPKMTGRMLVSERLASGSSGSSWSGSTSRSSRCTCWGCGGCRGGSPTTRRTADGTS